MVEERGRFLLGRVDEDPADAIAAGGAVVELPVGSLHGIHLAANDKRVDVLTEHFDGAVVVGGGELFVTLGGKGKGKDEDEY